MSEILQTIGRLRRAMPRNADVMALCDWAEHSISAPRVAVETHEESGKPPRPKLTRAQIQRNYRLRKKEGRT